MFGSICTIGVDFEVGVTAHSSVPPQYFENYVIAFEAKYELSEKGIQDEFRVLK